MAIVVIMVVLVVGILLVVLRALPEAQEDCRKAEEAAGLLPEVPVVGVDLGSPVRGPRRLVLRDPEWGLVGSPDVLTHTEVIEKKTAGPFQRRHLDRPASGDLLQLAAYLHLCERDPQVGHPMGGRLQYTDKSGAILPGGDHPVTLTDSLRARLRGALTVMRQAIDAGKEVHRNHEAWGRCHGCRVRGICGEALEPPL